MHKSCDSDAGTVGGGDHYPAVTVADERRAGERIHHPLVLLADGHGIARIACACACGWANPSSFIAGFTHLVGTTPGRYRAIRQHAVGGP
ncbi:AraC family transcriptional regulator [Streptomyces sp. NPDC006184]|uniref:AraC family transcriptional regulator n=1 Tax=Streptomyces sp. NPDC006184 TaxID=3155455 RepID=UPI0033BECF84